MKLAIYDPKPPGNDYATFFLKALRPYATANGIPCSDLVTLTDIRDSHVVLLTDHLTDERIIQLKNNGNRIVGLNVTDSSYISGAIRYAKSLPLVDLIFMVSGVPNTNEGSEIAVDNDFNITLVDKPFLDEENWNVFDYMRKAGRLLSLPYVPWTAPPDPTLEPYNRRSQKVILRGGGHARRFLLSLFLLRNDQLDPNSGFVLHPYFADDMNPQFRYCDECRADYKHNHRATWLDSRKFHQHHCNSPAFISPGKYDLSDLGQWNNRCPRSFLWMAEKFGGVDMALVEHLLNARWLHPKEHMAMLGRITFTSDLKWVHSIYKPQRFWEAAASGCISVLPERALNQDYFPDTRPVEHYLVYNETMNNLGSEFCVDGSTWVRMASANRDLYDKWINPGTYGINTNLLGHIVDEMRKL